MYIDFSTKFCFRALQITVYCSRNPTDILFTQLNNQCMSRSIEVTVHSVYVVIDILLTLLVDAAKRNFLCKYSFIYDQNENYYDK